MNTPSKVAAGVAVAALMVSNVVTNRWLPRAAYVPWNLAVAGGLLALARATGHSMDDMGLHPSRLRRGARMGAVGALLVGGGYAALVGSGKAGRLLSDRRLAGLTPGGTLWRLLVQIPIGTALSEEIAFRSVLPLFLRDPSHPSWASPALASVLFGLWHVLPARDGAAANGGRSALPMAVSAVATALGGAVLHRLHVRSGHVVAPVALHFATNGLGLLAVRMAAPRR